MALLIDESDVAACATSKDFVEAAEDGYRQHGLGLAETLPRREIRIRGKELPHADPGLTVVSQGIAFHQQSGVVAVSLGYNFPARKNPPRKGLRYLIDSESWDVIAIVDSVSLSLKRTGAGGAVGAKYLSRKNSDTAGIIGVGRQGRIQLKFLLQVRNIKTAYVYSPTPSRTRIFSEEMGREL